MCAAREARAILVCGIEDIKLRWDQRLTTLSGIHERM